MTRTWTTRLLALGGLALALGCRSHPKCPECHIPLFPEDVLAKPAQTATAPPTTGTPAAKAEGTILPPPPFTKLPAGKQPDVRLPDASPDGPAVVPPPDVAPLLSNPSNVPTGPRPREVGPGTAPQVKPLLVDAPKPPPGADGFAPAPKIGLPDLPPTVAVRPPVKDTRPPLPLRPGERFGHAPDYKWVAGILDKHQKGGYWTVRYAPSGDDDPWGGKVRLLDDDKLSGFTSGDVVYVEGDLLAPRSAAETATYPPYRVTDVRLIEKAK
jgi:hypothetical protein